MRYHTVNALSPHIRETPEGFLVCEGVAIARTGVQEYLAEEVPVEPGPNGTVLVVRTEEEVFAPATIASFEGKSLTLDHPEPDPDPDEPDVNPDNWRDLTCGIALNVRRGSGTEADLLLADLLVTDAEAIAAVREKRLRQVSCGYDAEYEPLRPGVGRQVSIIGNHIALVEHGRAGGRVAIQDAAPEDKGRAMAQTKQKKTGFWDRFTGHLKRGKTADEAAKAAACDEDAPSQEEQRCATDSGDEVAALTAKVDELTLLVRTLVENAAPTTDEETTDEDDPPARDEETVDTDPPAHDEDTVDEDTPGNAKTGDARRLRDARRSRVADAAMVRQAKAIYPGAAVRVGDAAPAVQKMALRAAARDAALSGMLSGLLAGRTIDALPPADRAAAFAATAALAGHVNNRKTADAMTKAAARGGSVGVRDFGTAPTPADINALNREFYSKK